jgi:hypothetical protein
MVLVIFLTNVLTRKRKEMKRMIQTKTKLIKEKEEKRKSSRKGFPPKKTTPHRMKMKLVKVISKEFYSWK